MSITVRWQYASTHSESLVGFPMSERLSKKPFFDDRVHAESAGIVCYFKLQVPSRWLTREDGYVIT
jgi:hypothetical protein